MVAVSENLLAGSLNKTIYIVCDQEPRGEHQAILERLFAHYQIEYKLYSLQHYRPTTLLNAAQNNSKVLVVWSQKIRDIIEATPIIKPVKIFTIPEPGKLLNKPGNKEYRQQVVAIIGQIKEYLQDNEPPQLEEITYALENKQEIVLSLEEAKLIDRLATLLGAIDRRVKVARRTNNLS